MKQFLFSQLILIAIILPSESLGRTWTDVKGRPLEGGLLACNEKQITIKRQSDQKEFTIKRSTLSASDNKYLNGIPSFRGCFPGMTHDAISFLRREGALGHALINPSGISADVRLVVNFEVFGKPEYKGLKNVAYSKDGTGYEWYQIAIDMHKGEAFRVSFESIPVGYTKVDTRIVPWASAVFKSLTKKYGKPDMLYIDPSKYKWSDTDTGEITYLAKWIKGDYEISLSIASMDEHTARVSYTHLPLLKKQKADEAEVEGNL